DLVAAGGYCDSEHNPVNPLRSATTDGGLADLVAAALRAVSVEPTAETFAVADEALAQRVSDGGPDELVHPYGDAQHGVERAEANAPWWQKLSADQRRDVIRAYPEQIGRCEGIPVVDEYGLGRHVANTVVLQRRLVVRDGLVERRDNKGVPLTDTEAAFVEAWTNIETSLAKASDSARELGVDGPYVWALDPDAFDGVGRALVSFSKNAPDPWRAKRVAWYVPGTGLNLRQSFGFVMGHTLNVLSSALLEDPAMSVAVNTWIGYNGQPE